LGVQVKTGDSYFSKPETAADREPSGWWYYEEHVEHFDDWVTHGLPHLLVLHDLKSHMSYWVHVEPKEVIITGEGAKILVPSDQRIDEDNLEALVKVAATQRKRIDYEGSAWRASATAVPPARRLRHALIAPRLIAPHRNAGFSRPVSPEEAIALLVQCRVRDVEEFSRRHRKVPDIEKAASSQDWRWRFFSALAAAVLNGDLTKIDTCLSEAKQHNRRAAAAVAKACWLIEGEQYDEVIELLGNFGDRAGPIDHAWILVQLARAQSEIGRIDEARSNAVSVLQSLTGSIEDVTASAIRAAASSLLYYTADIRNENLADAVTAGDTAVSWWRTQSLSWGLSVALDRVFRKEMHDTSKRYGFDEVAHNRILSSVFTSSFSGEQGAWINGVRLLSYNTLATGHGGEHKTAEVLDDLRRTGARAELSLATKYLWSWGPVVAIQLALQNVVNRLWNHTSASATLALIQHGGDVIQEDQADTLCARLITILEDSQPFVERVNPTFSVPDFVLDALAGVTEACGDAQHLALARFVTDLPDVRDTAIAMSVTRIVRRLRSRRIDGELAQQLLDAALRQSDKALSAAMLGAASVASDAAKRRLLEHVRRGDWDALDAFGDIRRLTSDDARLLAAKDAEQLHRIMAEAESGTFTKWLHDSALSMAIIGAWFPHTIDWELLAVFLRHPLVSGEQKRSCCIALAHHATHLPDAVRGLLAELAPSINDSPIDDFLGEPLGGAGVYLSAAVGALDESVLSKRVAALLTSSAERRADAAMIVGHMNRPDLIPTSAGLLGDGDPRVRLAAATSMAVHMTKSGDDTLPLAVECLHHIIQGPGTGLALRVVNAFYGGEHASSEVARQLLTILTSHTSALVRVRAVEALQSSNQ